MKEKDGQYKLFLRLHVAGRSYCYGISMESELHQQALLVGLILAARYLTFTGSVGTGAAHDRGELSGEGAHRPGYLPLLENSRFERPRPTAHVVPPLPIVGAPCSPDNPVATRKRP